MEKVSKISISAASGEDDVRDIGAEAKNIDVYRNSDNVISDTGIKKESLTTTLKNLEEKVTTDKIASATDLGMIKVGSGLSIDDVTGILSANQQSVDIATTNKAGIVKPSTGLNISTDGTLTVRTATSSTTGIVRPGEGLEVNGGVMSAKKATNSTLGMVKAGSNTVIDNEGRITINIPTPETAKTLTIKAGYDDQAEAIEYDYNTVNPVDIDLNKAFASTFLTFEHLNTLGDKSVSGHVKLVDYDGCTSVASAENHIAASGAALSTHVGKIGTKDNKGHVQLLDDGSSSLDVSKGVAATPLAVYKTAVGSWDLVHNHEVIKANNETLGHVQIKTLDECDKEDSNNGFVPSSSAMAQVRDNTKLYRSYTQRYNKDGKRDNAEYSTITLGDSNYIALKPDAKATPGSGSDALAIIPNIPEGAHIVSIDVVYWKASTDNFSVYWSPKWNNVWLAAKKGTVITGLELVTTFIYGEIENYNTPL